MEPSTSATPAPAALKLTPEQVPVFDEMLTRFEKRVAFHTHAGRNFLIAMLFCVVLAITVVALARTILGGDIEQLRRNEALLGELDTQKDEIGKDLQAANAQTKTTKAKFLKDYSSGQLWLLAQLPPHFASRLSWVDLRGTQGFAVGSQILHTEDGGQNWSAAKIPEAENNDPFEPADAGFALGGNGAQLLGWVVGKRGKIAKTTDGGATWQIASVTSGSGNFPIDRNFNYIFFKDTTTGWAIGDGGLIAFTVDGGTKWSLADSAAIKTNLYYARFYADNTGIIIGTGMTVLVSTDAGRTWRDESPKIAAISGLSAVPPGAKIDLLTMDLNLPNSYSDTKHVVLGGTDGVIIIGDRAPDNTYSWKLANLLENGASRPLAGNIATVQKIRWIDVFGSSENMVAVGDKGTLLISYDRGENWTAHGKPEMPSLYYVQTIATDRALITGELNYISQLELNSVSKPPSVNITQDSTPHSENTVYWISPRDQLAQVAVGPGGIMRKVSLSPALTSLLRLGDDDFRKVAVTASGNSEFFAGFPDNSAPKQILFKQINDLKQLDKQIDELQGKLTALAGRREKAISTEVISSQEFMWWLNGARALVVLIAFFVIRFLASLYRYHQNLITFYEARADALRIMLVLPNTLAEITNVVAPAGLDDASSSGGSITSEIVSAVKGLVGAQPKT
jgi:photosystem II stability/assembly factor-like uncharacterized protein